MPEPSQMTLRLFKASTFLCAGLAPFPSSEESGPHLRAEMMSPSDQNYSLYPSSRQPHSPSQNITNTSLQRLHPRPDPTLRLRPTNQLYTNPSSPPSTSHFLEGWTTAFPSIPTQQQTPFQPFLQSPPPPDPLPISTNNTNEILSFSPFDLPMFPLPLDVLESTFDVLESRLLSESPSKLPSPLSTPDISKTLSSGRNNYDALLHSPRQHSKSFSTCAGLGSSLGPGNQSLPIEKPSNTINNGARSSSPLQPSATHPATDIIRTALGLASAERSASLRAPHSQQYKTLSYFDNTEASIHSSSQATPSLSCPMEFQQTKSQSDCHVEPIHKNRCGECKMDFKERRYLRHHMKWKHNPAAVIHQCPHCQKRLADRRTLNAHVRAQHEGLLYPCSKCTSKFKYPCSLSEHEKKEHGQEGYTPSNVRYPCSQCNCNYKSCSALKLHIKQKHTPNAITYDCPHCPKEFFTKQNLRWHITSKHENLRYPCSQCKCKYSYASDLTKHMKQKHYQAP